MILAVDEILKQFNHKDFKVFDDKKEGEPLSKKGEKVLNELCEFLNDLSNTVNEFDEDALTFNEDSFRYYFERIVKRGF